jgi:hypothetical protein
MNTLQLMATVTIFHGVLLLIVDRMLVAAGISRH